MYISISLSLYLEKTETVRKILNIMASSEEVKEVKEVCRYWNSEGCIKGASCGYAHPIPEENRDLVIIKMLQTQQECIYSLTKMGIEALKIQKDLAKMVDNLVKDVELIRLRSGSPRRDKEGRRRKFLSAAHPDSVSAQLERLKLDRVHRRTRKRSSSAGPSQ